ncbi:hypothetical protein BDR04DRAFT_1116272 [Suillus decipiens]|nr:hypothetical protein BDR04DRAFT_1116272 [Suillus decipiens]
MSLLDLVTILLRQVHSYTLVLMKPIIELDDFYFPEKRIRTPSTLPSKPRPHISSSNPIILDSFIQHFTNLFTTSDAHNDEAKNIITATGKMAENNSFAVTQNPHHSIALDKIQFEYVTVNRSQSLFEQNTSRFRSRWKPYTALAKVSDRCGALFSSLYWDAGVMETLLTKTTLTSAFGLLANIQATGGHKDRKDEYESNNLESRLRTSDGWRVLWHLKSTLAWHTAASKLSLSSYCHIVQSSLATGLVQALSKLLDPRTADNIIAIPKKYCWCCECLHSLLAVNAVRFNVLGSHGIMYW